MVQEATCKDPETWKAQMYIDGVESIGTSQ